MKKTGLAELMDWVNENRVIIDSDDIISKGEDLLEKESSDISQDITHRNLIMTDMNGINIVKGHKLIYQKGTKYEAACEIIEKDGSLYFSNWSDNTENILADDFWHEPVDRPITEVTNPFYGG